MWKAIGTFYFEDELFFLLEKIIDDDEFVVEVDEFEFQVLDELGLIEWLE